MTISNEKVRDRGVYAETSDASATEFKSRCVEPQPMVSKSGLCRMNWQELNVRAIRGHQAMSGTVRFRINDLSESGDLCRVEVTIDGVDAAGAGTDLFGALAQARQALEKNGITLVVNGARRDVFPSAMLRQTSQGRTAYVHTMPRSTMRPVAVDIFEAATSDAELATVDEQRAWHEHWAQSQG